MKKILSIVMVALTSCYPLSVIAQPEPGTFSITPKVGVNASTMTGSPDVQITMIKMPDRNNPNWGELGHENITEVTSFRFCSKSLHYGWNGGVEASYQLSAHWALAGSLEYSLQGNSYDDFSTPASIDQEAVSFSDSRLSLHYLNVPLLVRCYVLSNLAVELGIQPGWCFKKIFKSKMTMGNQLFTIDDDPDVYSGFDFSIPVGLTYQIGKCVIGARYNIGLTNIYAERWDSYSEKSSARNSVFQLSLGYRFDL